MKKLMSLCLSLVLVLTLAAPAFAASVETMEDYIYDPDVLAWIDAHPEEAQAFLSGERDSELLDVWYVDGSVAELADSWGVNEAYIRTMLLEFWVLASISEEEWNAWVTEYEAAHPGIREQLKANAYDYFAKEHPWYDSPEEYMEDWELTEEEFITQMVNEQLYDLQEQEERAARLAAFEEVHPGVLAQLEANAYDYFTQEYIWYDSPEEYMEYHELTEEEFIAEMVDEQIDDILRKEAERERIDETKAALGGVPGQLGVMLNDTYLTFPDAVPEAVNGRVMVPYRPLMEALGGTVDYDAATQTVSCTLGETALTLTLGETALTVTENGETARLEMDCAAYAKNGRTYVPVRFVSQAFGYTVLWDADYETAVVLDLDALAEEIDQNFTILNRVLANLPAGSGPSYVASYRADLEFTRFDTLHGNEQYRFTMRGEDLTGDGGRQGTLTMDFSNLLKAAETSKEEVLADYEWYLDEEDLARLETLLDNLSQLSFEYISNTETGDLWLRAPLLGLLDSSLKNSWLHMDTDYISDSVPGLSGLSDAGDGPLTVGSLVCANYIRSAQTYYSYFSDGLLSARQGILSSARETAAIFGDDCFTHTAQGDIFTYEPSDEDLSATFTVDARGGVTGSLRYEEDSDWSWSTPYRVTCGFTLRNGTLELDLNYHEKNNYQIQLDLTLTLTRTDRAPLTAPPEGDAVVDQDSLFDW